MLAAGFTEEVAAMRILIADDEAQVRFALRVLLGRQSGVEIAGEAIDRETLLSKMCASEPDVLLVDWELPGLDVDMVTALGRRYPTTRLIALSSQPEVGRAALAAGAHSFVSKSEHPEQLLAAIFRSNASTRTRRNEKTSPATFAEEVFRASYVSIHSAELALPDRKADRRRRDGYSRIAGRRRGGRRYPARQKPRRSPAASDSSRTRRNGTAKAEPD
jgi:DNA-binding NarL/FixJ family response regulator